jgi:hypothetical protein
LKATPYEIGINTVASTEPDELVVTASVTALLNVLAGTHKVHVAIVEKSVGSNEFVLRKLLPSATGTLLSLPMAKDAVQPIGPLTWKVTNTQIDPTDLAVIVFVQDEVTKEVMQAEILSTPANLPTVVTSIEDPAYADKIHVFPSPADDEVNIVLPEPVRHASVLKLIDTFGKTVSEDILKKGSRTKTIATRELTAGMYLIHLETEKGYVRKKVMVIHKH